MSSFVYTTGLRNVGSYQVSGRPWLKNYDKVAPGYEFIEFPNVTKCLNIHNDSGSSQIVTVMFCKPTRSANMPNGTEYLSSSITQGGEFTVSLWVKFDSLAADQRVITLTNGTDIVRVQTRFLSTTPNWRLFVNGSVDDYLFDINTTDWINIVLVAKSGDTKLYANGTHILSLSDTFLDLNSIEFGGTTANFDGYYSSGYLFSKALTDAEVSELYTTTARVEPEVHSQAQYLESVWLFDDGEYYTLSPVDDATTVYDRVGNNNLTLNSGALTFANGWTIENAEARHSWDISGLQGVQGSVKTNRVLLKHDNAGYISVFASLTNIPASQMHELSGQGIDE